MTATKARDECDDDRDENDLLVTFGDEMMSKDGQLIRNYSHVLSVIGKRFFRNFDTVFSNN